MSTTVKAIYTPRNIKVEIEDVFDCGGKKLVVVKAINGKPFADGAKSTTQTAYQTVCIDELEECRCTPRDEIACPACRRDIRERYGNEIPF